VGVVDVEQFSNVDYVFVLHGSSKEAVNLPGSRSNRLVMSTKTDCVDFGAYGHAIEFLGGPEVVAEMYRYIVFVSSHVFGPILPKYWPAHLHWSRVFTSRLKDNVHGCSVSIACRNSDEPGGPGNCFQLFTYFEGVRIIESV
jgi:hypothetical protein